MMLGLDGATAIAPIEPVASRSKSGSQLEPESLERHRPPLSKPMYRTVGCTDEPLEARARPARAGPIERQRSAELTSGDCAMAVDQTAAKPRMTDEIRMGGVCSLREERATPPER